MESKSAFSVSPTSPNPPSAAQYHLRNPHFTGEDGFMIWFAGTSTICVVDLSTLNVFPIEGFLPQIDDQVFGIAMRCVAKDMGNVIIIAFIIDGMWSFAYYESGIEPDNHLINEILPRCIFLYNFPSWTTLRYGD